MKREIFRYINGTFYCATKTSYFIEIIDNIKCYSKSITTLIMDTNNTIAIASGYRPFERQCNFVFIYRNEYDSEYEVLNES